MKQQRVTRRDFLKIVGVTAVAATLNQMSYLDGIGKGYIVDAGTAVLRQHGFVNVLVEAGGDLMALGGKEC